MVVGVTGLLVSIVTELLYVVMFFWYCNFFKMYKNVVGKVHVLNNDNT